jgi:hypothetical protein
MNEDFSNSNNPTPIPRRVDLYIKKDYIKAVRIICRRRNFLFSVIVSCLLLIQILFLFFEYGYIAFDPNEVIETTAVLVKNDESITNISEQDLEKKSKTSKFTNSDITFEQASLVIDITNTILIFSSVLYVFMMTCGLEASFGTELGGLSHISRACVYSLIVLILLLPWQLIFTSTVFGATYTPRELTIWHGFDVDYIVGKVLLYLRFIGYSALTLILLILAQFRSFLWSRTVVRKLERSA